jgi:hypothetical protein
MNLLPKHNSHGACEYQMQKEVANHCKELTFLLSNWSRVSPKVYREVTIPEIGRRSDIIVKVTPRKIFNIECKVVDGRGVLKQAIDHLQWADYSYICIWDKAYIPEDVIQEMLNKGIGLLLWKEGVVMEAFGSRHNKNKDKQIRESVLKTLKKKDSEKTAELHVQEKLFNLHNSK